MKPKLKISRILGVTGWTRDHLADLLGVSNLTVSAWVRGRTLPHSGHMGKIDAMYDGIVKPLECEIDRLSDEVTFHTETLPPCHTRGASVHQHRFIAKNMQECT